MAQDRESGGKVLISPNTKSDKILEDSWVSVMARSKAWSDYLGFHVRFYFFALLAIFIWNKTSAFVLAESWDFNSLFMALSAGMCGFFAVWMMLCICGTAFLFISMKLGSSNISIGIASVSISVWCFVQLRVVAALFDLAFEQLAKTKRATI